MQKRVFASVVLILALFQAAGEVGRAPPNLMPVLSMIVAITIIWMLVADEGVGSDSDSG